MAWDDNEDMAETTERVAREDFCEDRSTGRLATARLRIIAEANSMGLPVTLRESEVFALIFCGLADDGKIRLEEGF